MKNYLFVIARTPSDLRTPLRDRLWELSKSSLASQTYPGFRVLVIGEDEKEENPFIYIRRSARTKTEKLIEAVQYIKELESKPDYIIRFDDDDLFNPNFLDEIQKEEFDCYADKYQAHLDMISGKSCLNDYPWLANTVVHKTEHALAIVDGRPLMTGDHSKVYHTYYSSKKVLLTPKDRPLYIRIISPTCLSLETVKGNQSHEEIYDFNRYENYKKSISGWKRFLFWKRRKFPDYLAFQKELSKLAKTFFPERV